MVEFVNPTRLRSIEDKTNPSGRLLDLTAQVKEGDREFYVRWLDKNGDGIVTLGTDQYVEVDASSPHRDETPRRVDYRFFTTYSRTIDAYVSTTLYDAMRELDDYFGNLPPLGTKDSELGQSGSYSCRPADKSYSYTAEQCAPHTITDFTIDDQTLPYITEMDQKSVSLEMDAGASTFKIDLNGSTVWGCRSIESCCNDYDTGYHLEVVGNSPDLRLIRGINKFYQESVGNLPWNKSNGKIYPAGCSMAEAGNF